MTSLACDQSKCRARDVALTRTRRPGGGAAVAPAQSQCRRLPARGGCTSLLVSTRLRILEPAAPGAHWPCRGSSASRAPRAKALGRRCRCRLRSPGRRAGGTAAQGTGRRPRTNGATSTPRAWSARPKRRASWSTRVSAAGGLGQGGPWGVRGHLALGGLSHGALVGRGNRLPAVNPMEPLCVQGGSGSPDPLAPSQLPHVFQGGNRWRGD